MHSLELLQFYDSAANVLVQINDGNPELKKICPLKASEAQAMLLPLHAKLDLELKKNTSDFHLPANMNCQLDCHCGLYADMSISKAVRDHYYQLATKTSPAQKTACAMKTVVSFCKSDLYNLLKSESEQSEGIGQ